MKSKIIMLFLIVVCVSCRPKAPIPDSAKDSEWLVFDFDKASSLIERDTIPLNAIVDSIRYVFLELTEKSRMSNLNFYVQPWQDRYIVSSGVGRHFTGLSLFSENGRYEETLIGIGHGSNELSPGIYEWSMDVDTQAIVLYGNGRMLFYSMAERKLRSIRTEEYCTKFYPIGEGRYAAMFDAYMHNGKTDEPYLFVYNAKGKCTHRFYYPKKRDIYYSEEEMRTSPWPLETYLLCRTSRHALFKDVFNDTIYRVTENRLIPHWYLSTGGKSSQKKDVRNDAAKYTCFYFTKGMTETERYAFVNFVYHGKYYTSVWDKSTLQLVSVSGVDTRLRGTSMVNNRHVAYFRLPDGKMVLIALVAFEDDKLYSIMNAKDAVSFLPDIHPESNPILMEMKLKSAN